MPTRRAGPVELRQRVAALERELAALRDEVRTRRLVLVDDQEEERVIAGVDGEVAEVRVRVPHQAGLPSTEVALFAAPAGTLLPSGVGVQLWADGDVVAELTWWRD